MKKHTFKKLMMIILLFAAGCQQCLLDSDSQPMIGFNPDSKFTLPNEENISMDINIENLKTGIFGFTFQFEYESSKLEMHFCEASEGSLAFFGESYISQIFIDPETVPCETIVTIEDDNQENECKKVYGTFVLENGQDLARGSGPIATCQFETIFSSTANINFIPEKFYFFNEYGIEIPHSYSSDISEQDSIDASIVEFEIINGKVYIDVQSNSFEDIDGNLYHEKQIGDQIWMVENLKVRHYNNGDVIPTELDNDSWSNTDEGAYAIYDDDPVNAEIYGNLYN